MPRYSKRSKDNLSSAHPDLQRVFSEVIKYFDCTIIEGHRSVDRQQELYAKGRTTDGPIVTNIDGVTKKGKHNYMPSLAVDAVPYPIDWQDTERMIYFAGFVMAISETLYERGEIGRRLRWGGDWDRDTDLKDQSFNDYPHFELRA